MEALLSTISAFISSVFTAWLPMVITPITGNAVLTLFVVAVPLVGIAIGIFNRLVRSN